MSFVGSATLIASGSVEANIDFDFQGGATASADAFMVADSDMFFDSLGSMLGDLELIGSSDIIFDYEAFLGADVLIYGGTGMAFTAFLEFMATGLTTLVFVASGTLHDQLSIIDLENIIVTAIAGSPFQVREIHGPDGGVDGLIIDSVVQGEELITHDFTGANGGANQLTATPNSLVTRTFTIKRT